MGRVINKFVAHVLPGIMRPMRILWNEIIGFFFIVLAVWAMPSAVRTLRHFDGDAESFFRVILSFSFAAIMLYFGITSFLRARRISRS